MNEKDDVLSEAQSILASLRRDLEPANLKSLLNRIALAEAKIGMAMVGRRVETTEEPTVATYEIARYRDSGMNECLGRGTVKRLSNAQASWLVTALGLEWVEGLGAWVGEGGVVVVEKVKGVEKVEKEE